MKTTLYPQLDSPCILVDENLVDANVSAMQQLCREHGVLLLPHIKTHKMLEVARRQLTAGADGLTCAKLSEAEAMLPSGVKRIFLAHSIVEGSQAPRVRDLHDCLDELILAVTSEPQADALARVVDEAGISVPVMIAVDSGLRREGLRDVESTKRLVGKLRSGGRLQPKGLYTHEGFFYSVAQPNFDDRFHEVAERLLAWRDAVDPTLELWPGCTVTAPSFARLPGVQAVRPGAYVFGDLGCAVTTQVMRWEDVAVTVLATVVDKPEPGLALINAGSKVFSSDKTTGGIFGLSHDRRDIRVVRVNEEHGYLEGADVDALSIGDRLRFVPAHICTVINLTDEVQVIRDGKVTGCWQVDARGCVA